MKHKLLIVEDSLTVSEALKGILTFNGYEVKTAPNGREALSSIQLDKPHLIISDIMMPIMDGLTFYKTLRTMSEFQDIPFIFLTAKIGGEDVNEAKKLGVDDYIKKPFSSADLLATVQGKLARMAELAEVNYRRHLNYIRDEIIKVLSHEFRTPLTKVKGYAELILAKLYQNEQQLTDFANSIAENGNRLELVIDEFILVTRFELEANSENHLGGVFPVMTGGLANSVIEKIGKIAKSKKITINLIEDAEELWIRVCEADIREALFHVLLNAIKFSPEGSQINFRILVTGQNVCFEIQDFGPGMDSVQINQIFEKFYQANRLQLEQQGLGLGLTITKMATGKNKGTIHVHSLVGQGTTFQISFPKIPPPAENKNSMS